MSRPFEIEIAESEEELKKRLQIANLGNQKEKLQMLWWIKNGQIKEQQEIGFRLAKDTSTVTRWLQKYRTGGRSELLKIKKAPGAKRKIPDGAIAALKEELKTEKGFSKWGDINKRQTLDTAPKALCPLHRQSLSLIDHPKRFAVYFSLGT